MKKISKKHICERFNFLFPNYNFGHIYRNLKIIGSRWDLIHCLYGRYSITYHINGDYCSFLYGLLSC